MSYCELYIQTIMGSTFQQTDPICSNLRTVCVDKKHYDCLRRLKDSVDRSILFDYAMASGNIHVVVFLHDLENYKTWGTNAIEQAAQNGYFLCLYYAHKNGAKFGARVCGLAAESGHTTCLMFAHKVAGAPLLVDPTSVKNESCLTYLECHLDEVTETLITNKQIADLKRLVAHYGFDNNLHYYQFLTNVTVLAGISDETTVCNALRKIQDQLTTRPVEFIDEVKRIDKFVLNTKISVELYCAVIYARFDIIEQLMAKFALLDANPPEKPDKCITVSRQMMYLAAVTDDIGLFKYLYEECGGRLCFDLLKCEGSTISELAKYDCMHENNDYIQYVSEIIRFVNTGGIIGMLSIEIIMGRFENFSAANIKSIQLKDPDGVSFLYTQAARSTKSCAYYKKLNTHVGRDPNITKSLHAAMVTPNSVTKDYIISKNPGLLVSIWSPEFVMGLPIKLVVEYWPAGARKNIFFGIAKIGGPQAIEVMQSIYQSVKNISLSFDAENDNPEYIVMNWSTVRLDIRDINTRELMQSYIAERFAEIIQGCVKQSITASDIEKLRLLADTWNWQTNYGYLEIAFRLAITTSNLTVCQFLQNLRIENDIDCYKAATKRGCQEILQLLLHPAKYYTDIIKIATDNKHSESCYPYVRPTTLESNLSKLKQQYTEEWIRFELTKPNLGYLPNILIEVATFHPVECFRYLFDYLSDEHLTFFMESTLMDEIFRAFVKHDKIQCLRFLNNAMFDFAKCKDPKRLSLPFFPRDLLIVAIESGNARALEFIGETVFSQDIQWAMDTVCIRDLAIERDQAECLSYILNGHLKDTYHNHHSVIFYSARCNSPKCFKYARKHLYDDDSDKSLMEATTCPEILDALKSQ